MKTKTMLHILRNPYGHSDKRKNQARLKAADEIEKLITPKGPRVSVTRAEMDRSINTLEEKI